MERHLLAVLSCGSAPLMETKYVQKDYLFLLSLTQSSCVYLYELLLDFDGPIFFIWFWYLLRAPNWQLQKGKYPDSQANGLHHVGNGCLFHTDLEVRPLGGRELNIMSHKCLIFAAELHIILCTLCFCSWNTQFVLLSAPYRISCKMLFWMYQRNTKSI